MWSGAHSSADEDSGAGYPGAPSSPTPARAQAVVETSKAPVPYAAYAHARRVGDVLYLAGIGPRDPKTNATVGGPVYDDKHKPLKYDIKKQTEQVLRNIETILKESGCTMEDVFDVSAFLIDMKNDFAGFNEVYNKWFGSIKPARTTVQVEALPGPIAVELKVVAKIPPRS
jgi:2-aminomuconate deaminase